MKGQVHWHQGAGEHPRQHQGVGVHRGRWQHHRALADYHPAHVVPQRWQRKDGATGQRPALPQTQGQCRGKGRRSTLHGGRRAGRCRRARAHAWSWSRTGARADGGGAKHARPEPGPCTATAGGGGGGGGGGPGTRGGPGPTWTTGPTCATKGPSGTGSRTVAASWRLRGSHGCVRALRGGGPCPCLGRALAVGGAWGGCGGGARGSGGPRGTRGQARGPRGLGRAARAWSGLGSGAARGTRGSRATCGTRGPGCSAWGGRRRLRGRVCRLRRRIRVRGRGCRRGRGRRVYGRGRRLRWRCWRGHSRRGQSMALLL